MNTTIPYQVEDCEDNWAPYHNGTSTVKKIPLEDRLFVVWDGEGVTPPSNRKETPQNLVLFGCYNGTDHQKITNENLRTRECLDFILEQGKRNPGTIHVSFYFKYDVNMILGSVSPITFEKMHTSTTHSFYYGDKGQYRIEYIPGKWFRVTKYGRGFNKNNRNGKGQHDKETVTIFDMASFFGASLVKSLKSYIPNHPMMIHLPEIEEGKDRRGTFTFDEIDYITKYWEIENVLFHALANRLREMLYSVGLRISKWYGPGALANYTYQQNKIQAFKADCGDDVYDAARYAYAGGRFELFRTGRFANVYGIDLNSAYPAAIAKLPNLAGGIWTYNPNPTEIKNFSMYHVFIVGEQSTEVLEPSPLFHRDHKGNITFPWTTDGWYWDPEVTQLIEALKGNGEQGIHHFEIKGAWEFTPADNAIPFEFVPEMYYQRLDMKSAKEPAEWAIKLCLNSLYGKMAQRAGWKRSGKAPKWHQLEWAGWVTSYTRAQLYSVMRKIPWNKLIAVETDGIYTTATPEELGINNSTELGEWGVTKYDEVIYLQSGVYGLKPSGEEDWKYKYRGLDPDSLSIEALIEHTKIMGPNMEWPPLQGMTTRFVSYAAALWREKQNMGPFKVHHKVWETKPKEVSIGDTGKRVHYSQNCEACFLGLTAYKMPHDLTIHSPSIIDPHSYKHDIPWIEDDIAEWREVAEEEAGLIAVS